MNTDLYEVKERSKLLFDAVSLQDASDVVGLDGFIISHPFTNSSFVCIKNENGEPQIIDLLQEPEHFTKFRKKVFETIDKAEDVGEICWQVNKPYRLFWFKLINSYLSEKDFGNYLSEIWMSSENPNDDVNVSLKEVIKWFKKADKKYLMDDTEQKIFSRMPEEFEVYRGVSKNRNPKGLSYSLDKNKAIWFQERFADNDNPGFLIEKKIKKEEVLAYLNRRGEEEIVLNVQQ